uniref:Uncharacterized protein n=1 Tax=Candidatus Kentrum sp. LFY TaxID=2126342 RepID=A0A450U520_9GAMM|nr:MAG: hypothetical protein BECKLFY1418B_GA0070995_10026 [Candidatus Kentron sp. LFY]VFJ88422.1 MAG: hypothetical protein BECKLFY1418A_GA0070994_100427 [Candidatus Kentron sp. LFY]
MSQVLQSTNFALPMLNHALSVREKASLGYLSVINVDIDHNEKYDFREFMWNGLLIVAICYTNILFF